MIKKNAVRKHFPKILSAAMAATIMCSAVGVSAYSAGAEKSEKINASAVSAKDAVKAASSAGNSFFKEETVYVIAGADGAPQKIIVSDWIKNPQKADKITDKSSLSDIETTKGDQTYTVNEKNMMEWGANGEDIYYKGYSNQELPVGLSVKYELDGKAVSPEELAGKSGKLKMTFNYTNRKYEEVKIGDKKEKIYVPFVMLTGMMLDNEKVSNITVSNGKVVNDGTRTYAAGFALPGVSESLGISDDKLSIPSSVEVTADVKDFELTATITVATNEIFNDIDADKLDGELNSLKKKLSELTDGVKKLADGSSQLYSGLGTLLNKSGELIEGAEKLRSGAEQLKSGSESLKSGAESLDSGAGSLDSGIASLQNGAQTLDSGAGELAGGAAEVDSGVARLQGYIGTLAGGLGEISSNSEQLKGGAKQVFDTLLGEADKQIAAAGIEAEPLTIDNYASVLDGIIAGLDEETVRRLAYDTAYKTVSAAVESQRDVIRQAVEAEVRKQVLTGVLAAAGLGFDSESYEQAVAAGQIPEDVQAQVAAAVAAQMAGMSDTIDANTEAQIQSLIEANMQGEEVQAQIAEAVAMAAGGKQSLEALKNQLNSYNTFYRGIISYTAGVDSASSGAAQILGGTGELKQGTETLAGGAGQLKSGTGSLKDGADTLKDGSSKLKDGTSSLKSGTVQLNSGAVQLYDGTVSMKEGATAFKDGVSKLTQGSQQLDTGMKKLKKEGVDAIVNAFDGDLTTLSERFKAMIKVSKNYKSFSGISEGANGKTDFIFKTDSIVQKKDEDGKK